MSKNVGGLDRIVRLVVGLAMVIATVLGLLPVWGWAGLVLVGTAAIGICPAYLPLGIKTCKTE